MKDFTSDDDNLRIYPIDKPGNNPNPCDFCPELYLGYWLVSRTSSTGSIGIHFCCDRCADGWREIGDRNNELVI